ncbi:MAG: hypothetical protein BZY83_00925 [SAR202 cluster bacterium Casp-Chloro-G2]|nr:MAG: hypothetical protein BZY83_00925 [SAR202 cluster bacterium Casp-Chloro-G2]
MMLETGRTVDLGSFHATPESVDEYLRSVGDELPVYREAGIAPPLYSAAKALGALLTKLELPPGAIHSLQEIETLAPIGIAGEIIVSAYLEKPRRRAGLEFLTAVCTIESGGVEALRSKTTVLLPSGEPAQEPVKGQQSGERKPAESGLPVVTRQINQEQLNAYAVASGDDNPLHLDAGFAAGTQFGGIIAHGMLTLAFISEMMTGAHGRDWLESASLRVRFKGAAYLGDQVDTTASLTKEGESSLTYSVGAINSASGQELIAGSAGVSVR